MKKKKEMVKKKQTRKVDLRIINIIPKNRKLRYGDFLKDFKVNEKDVFESDFDLYDTIFYRGYLMFTDIATKQVNSQVQELKKEYPKKPTAKQWDEFMKKVKNIPVEVKGLNLVDLDVLSFDNPKLKQLGFSISMIVVGINGTNAYLQKNKKEKEIKNFLKKTEEFMKSLDKVLKKIDIVHITKRKPKK